MENTKIKAEVWGSPEGEPCPYCGKPKYRHEGRNALSRWLTNTYICPKCGDFEAFVDLYRRGAKLCFTGLATVIGIAIEGRAGYIPLSGDCGRLIPYKKACQIAKSFNGKLREPIDEQEELRIVGTTIRAQHIGF